MTGSGEAACDAVLFDLDGTLVDTAPDMVAALAAMQKARRAPLLSYELARSHVSNGALGLVRLAFPDAGEEEMDTLRDEFLRRYAAAVCVESTVFPGLLPLLDELERRGLPWGVVTNKPARMTAPVLAGLGLATRAGCAISGDTLAERKPHPAPLLQACRELGVARSRSVYVGDALRDIEAGRAAGMATIAVCYGYIPENEDPADWGADQVARDAGELAQLLLGGAWRRK